MTKRWANNSLELTASNVRSSKSGGTSCSVQALYEAWAQGYCSASGGVLRSLAKRFLSMDFSYASSGEIHFLVRRS